MFPSITPGASSGNHVCEHPYLALAYTALGYYQNSTEDAAAGFGSHSTALRIRKAVLGASSLDVALSQNQLAISMMVSGRFPAFP